MSNSKDVRSVKISGIRHQQIQNTSIRYIKGVGPRRAQLLERLGIKTFEDILYYFPWRYENRKTLKKIRALTFGEIETATGRVVTSEIIRTRRRGMKIFELILSDDTGSLKCKWFNQPYLEKYFKKDQEVVVSGLVKGRPPLTSDFSRTGFSCGPEMENPDFELYDDNEKGIHTARIVPVYKATEGFTPKQIRSLIFKTLGTYPSHIQDFMPGEILKRNGLKTLPWSIREIHFPEEYEDVNGLNRMQSPAHRRLVFDEFFLLELGLALMKKRETAEKGICFRSGGALLNTFLKGLPF